MSRLSILTPTFNGAAFLENALQSVRALGGDVEHIVVDGASADDTISILKKSEWPGLRWISEPDKGQSDALNKALAMATGEIIGWLNGDEWYLEGIGDQVRRFFDKHPETDVLFGEYCMVEGDRTFVRSVSSHRFSRWTLRYYGCFVPSCATFMRRSCLAEAPWDSSLKWVMDWDLWMKLDENGSKFSHIREQFSAFTLHPAQVTAGDRSPHAHEWSDIQARYKISTFPGSASNRIPGRLAHAALKLIDGAYARQRAAERELKGQRLAVPDA
jgi:glycosyltransferase involved in cell wall biosynthesis